MDITFVLLIILFISNFILFFLWFSYKKKLDTAFKLSESGEDNFSEVFKKYIEKLESTDESIKSFQKNLDEIEEDAKKHLQYMKFTRFNPFKETGGEQSFILILLDDNQDGIILTGLNSRTGSRLYAKLVKEGKSEIKLSEEEEKLLNS